MCQREDCCLARGSWPSVCGLTPGVHDGASATSSMRDPARGRRPSCELIVSLSLSLPHTSWRTWQYAPVDPGATLEAKDEPRVPGALAA